MKKTSWREKSGWVAPWRTPARFVMLTGVLWQSVTPICLQATEETRTEKKNAFDLYMNEVFVQSSVLERSSDYLRQHQVEKDKILQQPQVLIAVQEQLRKNQIREVRSLARIHALKRFFAGLGAAAGAVIAGNLWFLWSGPSFVRTEAAAGNLLEGNSSVPEEVAETISKIQQPVLWDRVVAAIYRPLHWGFFKKKPLKEIDAPLNFPSFNLVLKQGIGQTEAEDFWTYYEHRHGMIGQGTINIAQLGALHSMKTAAWNGGSQAVGSIRPMIITPVVASEREQGRYAALRPFVNRQQREFVDGLFIQYWSAPSNDILRDINAILDVLEKLPLAVNVIDEARIQPGSAFAAGLEDYQSPIPERFLRLAKKIALRAHLDAANQVSQFAPYLLGDPGVGKTHAANLLAKHMGTSFVRLNFDGALIDDIVGRDFSTTNATPGLILEALMSAAATTPENRVYSNSIVFIDEFDKLFTSPDSADTLAFVLKLLDPDNMRFYSPYLHAEVDLSQCTFILSGNAVIDHPALEDRLETINFPSLPDMTKLKLAFEVVLPELLQYYHLPQSFVDDSLREEITQLVLADHCAGLRGVKKIVQQCLEKRMFG